MIKPTSETVARGGSLAIQFVKFGLVGVVNTAVGFLTIVLMMNLVGLGPVRANMVGYGVGLLVSFILNKRYTFASKKGKARQQFTSFLAVFAVAYTVNLIVLTALATQTWPMVAQAVAMAAYTLTFFFLARVFVFSDGSTETSPAQKFLLGLASDPVSWRLAFACSAAMLGAHMLPFFWTGNEINYFDLAYRVARPEQFTEFHAVFDNSNARFVSLYLIGFLVNSVGFEVAHVALTLALWVILAAGLASVARALQLSLVTVTLSLFAFFELGQALMGGEWIFAGVESKVMAYAAVFFGLSSALRGRYGSAVVLAAIATYLHFLVGGFWAVGLIALAGLQHMPMRRLAALMAGYAALIAPIFLIILVERIGASPPDMTGIDLTANQIYAEFRNPHHVAPFKTPEWFQSRWLPGLWWTVGAVVLLVIARLVAGREKGVVLVWATGLNLFLLAAFAIAYFDRDTHVLAPLYLFRPAALTLLISLFVLIHGGLRMLPTVLRAGISGITIVLFAVFAVPGFVSDAVDAVTPETLASEMDDAQRDLIDWVQGNTARNDPILFAPWPEEFRRRNNISWLAMERMTGRPTFVDYKFVPTGHADLVRWYRLLKWRELVFATGCKEVTTYPVAILIFRGNYDGKFDECTEPLWANDQFTVLKIVADAT